MDKSTSPGELMNEVNALTRERDQWKHDAELAMESDHNNSQRVDELRAEVERLQELAANAFGQGQVSGLQAPVEQIKELQAEVARLRAALAQQARPLTEQEQIERYGRLID